MENELSRDRVERKEPVWEGSQKRYKEGLGNLVTDGVGSASRDSDGAMSVLFPGLTC